MTAQWRPMYRSDLSRIQALAGTIHPAYPEDDAVFAQRLSLCPAGCLVLGTPDATAGYVLSHPWRRGAPPRLNTLLEGLPPRPECWYVHDLAIAPAWRGQGAAGMALDLVERVARQAGFGRMELVATSGAVPFWKRRGFMPAPDGALLAASYGDGALLMERPVT
ncbi:GNAT family N-acetyltransferase [Novacetimonas pomaceti]|uniref:GNAT family N-acetyltransferase n=1 Tax=Novacetimonas pomaceti TaxID=2021998 RepID=A0A318QUI1_9PROT|nr:GNAT family N-acetyltransferase [Novacetimonas pomaceti]PYD76393.1 GNAT family N-acetyltransferase [Novacetimonas pomaceti]